MKRLLPILFFFAISAVLHAQPGTLDKNYGNKKGAEIINNLGALMFCSAIQPDDKLVVGGEDSGNYRFIVSRHNKDGSIDSSFGTNGKVNTLFNADDYVLGYGNGWQAMAIQPDGKIVAVGIGDGFTKDGQNYNIDILLARFLPDGTPDKSFGTEGKVVTDIGNSDRAFAITLQPDGKTLVAGQAGSQLLLIRYNTDGSLDDSFAKGIGYVISPVNYTTAHAIALQPDGKIVAAGGYDIDTYFFTARYLPDGTVDKSFGENGSVTTYVSDGPYGIDINSIVIVAKGKILASGNARYNDNNNLIAVFRYLQDGTLDNSFDEDGKKIIGFSGGNGFSATILMPNPDKIIVAGYAYTGNPNADFALASLNSNDGSFDSSFGNNGQTTSDFGFDEETRSAVLQSDGKIILTSYDFFHVPLVYTLARYFGYPTKVPLAVRIKRFIHNHSITWNGLPAEDNIAYYSVEQSSLSTKGFTPIAKLGGRSNLQDYSITNSNLLPATNYYRIKAVSTDGTIRYSEVVSADNINNTASVFPNPAKSYVTVLGLQTNATANISIKDGSGTILTRGTSSGSTQYRSQVSNLLPGTYYLNVTTAGKTETLPFVKE